MDDIEFMYWVHISSIAVSAYPPRMRRTASRHSSSRRIHSEIGAPPRRALRNALAASAVARIC